MIKKKYEFPAYGMVAIRKFYFSRSEFEIINDPTKLIEFRYIKLKTILLFLKE